MSGGPLLTKNVSIQSPPELLKATIAFARKHGFTDVFFSAADEAKCSALVWLRAAMRRVHEVVGKIFVASYAYVSFQLVGSLMHMPVLAGSIALTARDWPFWDEGNFDGDNDIDITDINFLASNFVPDGYGASNAILEPSSFILYVFGILAVSRFVSRREVG